MGACSLSGKKGRTDISPSKNSRFLKRSRSLLKKQDEPSSSLSSSDSSVTSIRDTFISSLPLEYQAKITNALQTHVLDLSSSDLESLPCDLTFLPGIQTLNLTHNFLTSEALPCLTSSSLIHLLLNHNRIQAVAQAFFLALPALESLHLGRNSLSQFPTFPTSPAAPLLVHLDLHCNLLTVLPEELTALTTLRHLGLSSNRLASFSPHFASLSLISLDLSGNMVAEFALPAGSPLAASLETLNLSGNQMTRIECFLTHCGALTSLNASGNLVETISDELPFCSPLKTLNLSNNQLQAVPPSISHLTSLTDLDLSSNRLVAFNLPTLDCLAENLTYLRLQKNRLQDVSPHLYAITSLMELNLSHNQLNDEQVSGVSALSFLATLDLSGNAISELPEHITHIEFLADLSLSHNAIQNFPTMLCEIGFLKHLDVSFNQMAVLPDAFGQLAALESLNLSHNHLECLPDTFGEFKSLASLNLSFNHLRQLPFSFGQLPSLGSLFLHHNHLDCLPSSIVHLNGLSALTLSANNFSYTSEPSPSLSTHILIQKLIHSPVTPSILDAVSPSPDSREAHRSNSIEEEGKVRPDLLVETAHRSNSDVDQRMPSPRSFWINMASFKSSLHHLSLAGNSLQSVPPVIFTLSSLHHLDLSHNTLPLLSPEIQALSRLRSLDLSNNPIATLPPALLGMTQLQNLEINFTEIPHDVIFPGQLKVGRLDKTHPVPGEPPPLSPSSSWEHNNPSDFSRCPIGAASMTGTRASMEDALIFQYQPDRQVFLVALFDGHGGSAVSTMAAATALSLFNEELASQAAGGAHPSFVSHTDDMIVTAEQFYSTRRSPFDGTPPLLLDTDPVVSAFESTFAKLDTLAGSLPGGTTALMVYRVADLLYVANAGDCRAVLAGKNDLLLALSVDHTPRLFRERRRLASFADSYLHMSRVQGVLAVSRAIGDVTLHPWVTSMPDVSRIRIPSTAEFLIVACDGFWDVFSNQVAVSLARQSLLIHHDPALAALHLRDAAFARGSKDNISICIIVLH